MNDDPAFVRFEERVAAGKASINGISILPIEEAMWDGRQLIDFRTNVTVAAMAAAIEAQRGR